MVKKKPTRAAARKQAAKSKSGNKLLKKHGVKPVSLKKPAKRKKAARPQPPVPGTALEVDYDRLEELRGERESLADDVNDAADDPDNTDAQSAADALAAWDEEHGEELKELTEAAGECSRWLRVGDDEEEEGEDEELSSSVDDDGDDEDDWQEEDADESDEDDD